MTRGGHRYFAYGMNMHVAEMAVRCPGAVPVANAVLAGHRFVINGRGVATVVPDADAAVHGLLWDLHERHLAALDEFEGVPWGNYRRDVARLDLTGGDGAGGDTEAFVYVAADATPSPPRPGYLELVIEAAEDLALPAGYLSELQSWSGGPPPHLD